MFYNPRQLEEIHSLTDNQRDLLEPYLDPSTLNKFINTPRNMEEIGIDFIHSSSQIEGNTYTLAETDDLLKLGITAGGKKYSDAKMLLNMRDAYNMTMSSDYSLGYDFLLDLHYSLSKELLENKYCGSVRDFEVRIGRSKYIPLSDKVSLVQEMKYMLSLSEKIEHPIEKAIYTHLNICYLQFFADCNKRTARNYQNAILVKAGIMPLLFDEQDSKEYSNAVVEYYETGNGEPYVRWFINAYVKMCERLKPQEQPEIPRRISTDFNVKD